MDPHLPMGQLWMKKNVDWESPQLSEGCTGATLAGRGQFSPAEDGLLALSPPELIAVDYTAQGDLQLRTDDLQWLLNPESSFLRLTKCCQ